MTTDNVHSNLEPRPQGDDGTSQGTPSHPNLRCGGFLFQVGYLSSFSCMDPEFHNEDVARAYTSTLHHSSRPVGFWSSQERGSELLEIYFDGEWFKK
jgi:hypothetical protein